MKKILIIISLLVGMPLKAQTKYDFKECVQEFFDILSVLNETMPGESAEIDKVDECEKMYKGEFFNFNKLKDVSFNEFLTYYKTHVLNKATVTHDVLDLDSKSTDNVSQSFRLSNVRICRTFEDQSSQSSAIRPYSDTITCSILVTWKGKNDYPSISINGISYTEPLEKTPQVIAVRRTPILKVSKAFTSVPAYSGFHRVSVISYCDTEFIYTNGESITRRDTLDFKVTGNKYEVYNNDVIFYYSSNPNKKERILKWTLEQNETRETCEVTVIQK